MSARRAAFVMCVGLLLSTGRPGARVYLTVQQALDSAFPKTAKVERRTLYLDEGQVRRAAEISGAPVEARVVPY